MILDLIKSFQWHRFLLCRQIAHDFHDTRDEGTHCHFWIGLRYFVDWQFLDGSEATENSVHWTYGNEPDASTSSQNSCAWFYSDTDSSGDLLTDYRSCSGAYNDYYGICELYHC